MSQKMTLDSDKAMHVIRDITVYMENIRSATSTFQQELHLAYEKSDLGFLNLIAKSMADLEKVTLSLVENFNDIEVELKRYIRDMSDFSEESSGLY